MKGSRVTIRIPAAEFQNFTDMPTDRATELVVSTSEQLITLTAGATVLHLTRDQADQLNRCFSDWLTGKPVQEWSDFWTMALK